MDTKALVAEIGAEIDRLQQVRALLVAPGKSQEEEEVARATPQGPPSPG